MFTIETEGHWRGDPNRFCGRLVVAAEEQDAAELLAPLAQVMYSPEQRHRLLTALHALGAEAFLDAVEHPRAGLGSALEPLTA